MLILNFNYKIFKWIARQYNYGIEVVIKKVLKIKERLNNIDE